MRTLQLQYFSSLSAAFSWQRHFSLLTAELSWKLHSQLLSKGGILYAAAALAALTLLFSLLTFSSFCCYISCAAVLPLFIGCNGYNGRPFELTRLGFTCFYFRLMLLPISFHFGCTHHAHSQLLFSSLHHTSHPAHVTLSKCHTQHREMQGTKLARSPLN